MADVIKGTVTRVIDGDTFEMSVTSVNAPSGNRYNRTETIRIANVDAPELNTPGGQRSRDALERKLLRKNVACTVQARDTFGRVVASVRIG
jgi:endonuclease YncB( thermonuclease family)